MPRLLASIVRKPLFGQANMLLPGLYAWALTVAAPAHALSAPSSARVTAWMAPGALLSGVVLAPRWPRVARVLGINVFVGLCLLTWVLAGASISAERVEPLESALGGFGWVLFALGWGTVREPGRVPEEDPRVLSGPALPSRGALPRGSSLLLAVALVAALVPLALAWTAHRAAHALLGQAVALLAALALVQSGALLGTERGRPLPVVAAPARLRSASSPLLLLGCTLLLGLAWAVWRPR
jgi:hypothetical protein